MKTSDPVRILGDIRTLSRSWVIHLRAENKAATTITSYTTQLADFLAVTGMPVSVTGVTREHIETFLIDVMKRTTASTAATRFRGLQQFFRWLVEEGELTASPMTRMKRPKVPEKQVPVITTGDLMHLLGGCKGTDFLSRRDHAILRLLLNTGIRRAELANLSMQTSICRDRSRCCWLLGRGAGSNRSTSPERRPVGLSTAISVAARSILTEISHHYGWVPKAA